MKKILAVIVIVQFSLHSCAQLVTEQIVPDSIVLRLKIKSATKQVFFDGSLTSSMIYTEKYDSLGGVIEELSYNNHTNSLSIRKQFSYDSERNISLETYTHFSDGDSTTDVRSYCYNLNGYIDSNSFGKIEYQFNELGQILEMTEKTIKPYSSIIKFIYDDRYNLIKKIYYSGPRYRSRREFRYDNIGLLVEEINSYGVEDDPSKVYIFSYSYNDMNLVKEITQTKTLDKYENKKDSRIYKFTYDFK